MESMSLSEIARAVGGNLSGPNGLAQGVSIDSRTIKPGELFVAIKGPNFDGQEFITQAIGSGASGIIASGNIDLKGEKNPGLIKVSDTLGALKELAYFYRKKYHPKMIGITGTNGKTSVKEMTAAILSARYNVLKNQGNLNNQYGIPLSLFRLSGEHQIGVMELGMSALGEIADLCRLVEPEIGIITNVGEGHTLFLKDLPTVGRAKGELLEALPKGGLAVVNGDDANVMLQTARTRAKIIKFGLGDDCHYRAQQINYRPDGTSFIVNGQRVIIRQPGLHNVYNCLAAIAAGEALGVDIKSAAEKLAGLKPTPMRLEIIQAGKFTIINDAYNANPPSMRAAIKVLGSMDASRRKVAILGEMLELGEIEKLRHHDIGVFAAEHADLVVAVGRLGDHIHQGASSVKKNSRHYQDNAALIAELGTILKKGDLILVKASRGGHFEEIVNAIKGLS
jgi:UDP-N-acetylmuramoyl-tripeptide--D-alanyl-D-alanine ligase